MLQAISPPGWLILNSGLRVHVEYERDYRDGSFQVFFLAERKPTAAEVDESREVLAAILLYGGYTHVKDENYRGKVVD